MSPDKTVENKYFVIDFDSTFTQVEALDELAKISLQGDAVLPEVLSNIQNITHQGMEGKISFRESLEQRIQLLKANKKHLKPLIEVLKQKVSTSIKRNKEFFENYSERVYILSNGFKEFIIPIVTGFGINQQNVFANTFKYDDRGDIVGFDDKNVLAANNGKALKLKELNLQGEVHVIGDGHTDYEIKAAGMAHKFFAFTENVERDTIKEKADHIAPSLDEYLYIQKLNTALSYPKNRIKVLLLENIHAEAVKMLKAEGYPVEVYPKSLPEEELIEKIKDVSILGIRSKTQITKKVLDHAERLLVLGAFGIGTNQIDLEECTKKGISVFNAPYSSTRSVVELALGSMIMLVRNLPDKIMKMHQGKWSKSAQNSYEIRGKKLGIIGYGNIGQQLSVLAESLGMEVYYYDLVDRLSLGNSVQCESFDQLLSISDIISLHVFGGPTNYHLIGEEQFCKMKDGVIFINLSRGSLVDLDALRRNIELGKVGGAAIDVFPEEPKTNEANFMSVLTGLPNTILTPHVGGSTQEAQQKIANFVPNKMINNINTGGTTGSVNFPNLQLPELKNAHRLIHIHHNVPGILAKINNVLADHQINIAGQYLKTNETIGYVITDIDKAYDKQLIKALKAIEHTVRFRVLY